MGEASRSTPVRPPSIATVGQEKLSAIEARWLAISAQGLSSDRPVGPGTKAHVRRAVHQVGVVQLDAINVLERTQRLVLFSRIGAYDPSLLEAMTGPGGELFETPGFRAALMPVAHHPLLRWRAASYGVAQDNPTYVRRVQAYHQANASYIAAVLAEVAERGPLSASALSDPRRRSGQWWQRRSDGRRALELLFARGDLAAWRTLRFERVYDLPERVIPASVLASPTPSEEEAQRGLVRLAAASLGVATVADLARYHLLNPATVKARVPELVEAGELVPVQVAGWRDPAVVPKSARPFRLKRTQATLLSPFDSLIWDRERTRRLFGFDYRVEVYLPEAKRRFGYYVLPLLFGDGLVGRLDLKADRKRHVLRVVGAYAEPDGDARAVAHAGAEELRRLCTWLGLAVVDVEPNGGLATALRRAVALEGPRPGRRARTWSTGEARVTISNDEAVR